MVQAHSEQLEERPIPRCQKDAQEDLLSLAELYTTA